MEITETKTIYKSADMDNGNLRYCCAEITNAEGCYVSAAIGNFAGPMPTGREWKYRCTTFKIVNSDVLDYVTPESVQECARQSYDKQKKDEAKFWAVAPKWAVLTLLISVFSGFSCNWFISFSILGSFFSAV